RIRAGDNPAARNGRHAAVKDCTGVAEPVSSGRVHDTVIAFDRKRRGIAWTIRDGRKVLGKIAASLRVAKHGGQGIDGSGVVGALIRQEEERSVLTHRSAEGSAKLVLMEDRLLRAHCKVVAGVQESVAIEIKNSAVKVIGSILDHCVYNAARIAAVFRVDG